MTAHSTALGWPIEWDGEKWVYRTKDRIKPDACRNCQRRTVPVRVMIAADLSATGERQEEAKQIDACIAPLVDALQRSRIDMRYSCCGHGAHPGAITLQDGRCLLVMKSAVGDVVSTTPLNDGEWMLKVRKDVR